MIRIFFDHHVIATHPAGASASFRPGTGATAGDDLVMTDPDGTVTVYPAGTFHGGGDGIACAGAKFDPTCPSCTGTGPARPATVTR